MNYIRERKNAAADLLLNCSMRELEEILAGLSDNERESVVSTLWAAYHRRCAANGT